jgi:hypothetical protein
MRKNGRILLPLMVVALHAPGIAAQTCLGLPSFADHQVHFVAGGEFPDSAMAYSVGVSAGRPTQLFGNLGVGQVSYDGLDGKSTLGFLEFGYQYPVGRLQFCPVAGGYFAVGPDDDLAGITVTTHGATAGLAAGVAFESGALSVIPNTAFKYEYSSQKVVEEDVGEISDTFTSTLLDVGLALVLYDRMSVQPIVHFPISGDQTEPTVGVYASVAIW